MKTLLFTKETFVWCLLALLTIVSWVIGDSYDPGHVDYYKYFTIGLMVLAFFKIRLVIMHFMEVGHAPWALRAIFEVWVVAVCSVIITLYLTL